MGKDSIINKNSPKRFLLNQLIMIRLFADLKRSFVGWGWLVIIPIFSILTWIFMKGAGILNPGNLSISYPAFVILSITIWSGFFDTYKSCSLIITNYGKVLLVNKLPMGIIILSEVIIGLFKFLIPFSIILIYFLITGIQMSLYGFFFPVVFLPLVLLGACVGILTGFFNAIAKDFSYLADNIIRIFMLFSPVVYSPDIKDGLLAIFIKYNPLTYLISSSRSILLTGELYNPTISIICILSTIVLFIFLSRFFIVNTCRILERGEI